MGNRWSSQTKAVIEGYYDMVWSLPGEERQQWLGKPATLENYQALREQIYPGADFPDDLKAAFRRGLLTREEAERIQAERETAWQEIVDCTCQPALPDGRENVCSVCNDHNNRIAEIEF